MAAYEYTPSGPLRERRRWNIWSSVLAQPESWLVPWRDLTYHFGHSRSSGTSPTLKKTSKSSSSTSLAVGEEGLAMDSSSKVHIEIIAESMPEL